MKRILVTGATGYIGAHVVKALVKHGHIVFGTDNNMHQNDISPYVSGAVIYWDITSPLGNSILSTFDAVVHLAAEGMVEPSIFNPLKYYNTNLFGTANVIDAVSDNPHFIYCSTGSAFNPEANPYAMSKRAAEDLVVRLPHYSILRFYNVSGNDGFKKFESGYYHLIRKAAAVAQGKFQEVVIRGTNYDTPDGTAIRNYTHVKDIVESIVKIVDHGSTFNIECLGNTTGYSVQEVIEAMRTVSGVNIRAVHGPKRQGDVAKSVLPQQSRFFSENSSLEDQCRSAWESV